jgi:hypothetical protein
MVLDDDETDQVPRWMRYMPKSKLFTEAQPSDILSDSIPVDSPNSGIQTRSTARKVVIRKSSNIFGPTSRHATTVEASLRVEKRKRSDDADVDAMEASTVESAPVRRKLKCRNTNMAEAAELFSIVKLK